MNGKSDDSSCLCRANKIKTVGFGFVRTSASIYFCVSLRTHATVCIYVSAYVGGLGSGTPEYTRWNVKCVFWAARGRGMSPKLTVTTLSGVTRVRVLWVTAGDGCVLMQGAPRGLLVSTACVQYANTHIAATCLSPPQHGSNVCVLIGVCFISARRSERVSLPQSMGLSFFFVEVVFGQPLAGAWWCSAQVCSLFVKLDLI